MHHPNYLTADKTNRDRARQLAGHVGLSLTPLGTCEPLPPAGLLICDWDELGDDLRRRVLELTSPELSVVLHSYDLDFERQRQTVWRRGIIVYRDFDSRLLAQLAITAEVV